MHEISIAQAIIETAEETLEKEKGSQILSITLCIGRLSGIVRESLTFCFPLLTKGTTLESCELIIEEIPLAIKCHDCQKESSLSTFIIQCPHCLNNNAEIISGKEFFIKNMEIC